MARFLWQIAFIFFLLLYAPPALAQTQPCITSANNQGLISGTNYYAGSALLGNTDKTCVFDPQAFYREFKVPTFNELENQFYFLTRSSAKRTAPLEPVNGALVLDGNGIYRQTSGMTLSSVTGSGVQVIFIKGDLNISGNIEYPKAGTPDPAVEPYSGLVFIVSGKINIYSTVTKVNAVLISYDTICTALIAGTCSSGSTITSQLVVNGSLLSLNKNNLPAPQTAIKLVRNLTDNTQPAELINKPSKFLYILKGGILTKDLIITMEDSNYAIPPDPGGTPVPPVPPLPPCPGATNPLGIGLPTNLKAVDGTCILWI